MEREFCFKLGCTREEKKKQSPKKRRKNIDSPEQHLFLSFFVKQILESD